jgi:hypothetical protein
VTSMKMPESTEEAVAQLGNVGRSISRLNELMTARQWQRAALIALLVGPERGKGRPPQSLTIATFPYSTVKLADLGIVGLRSANTVARYRNIWVRERPIPDYGDEVDLDGLPEWTGQPRAYTAGTATVSPNPTRQPEPGDKDYDTEAAAVRAAERAGTTRITGSHRWEPEEPPESATSHVHEVDVRVSNNKDGAHIDVGIALERLRSARRKRDEDYPTLNAYQKFGVRGNLSQIKTLIEELWPDINEAEETLMRKRREAK